MWLASPSVMVAVVQCASRVGGSPRLPTLRTPPFFWATASDALPATSAVDTSGNSTAPTISLDILHLPVVGEPNLSHARRACVGQAMRVPAPRPPPSPGRNASPARWRSSLRCVGCHELTPRGAHPPPLGGGR